jgi:hypothetical protein
MPDRVRDAATPVGLELLRETRDRILASFATGLHLQCDRSAQQEAEETLVSQYTENVIDQWPTTGPPQDTWPWRFGEAAT